MSIVKTLKMISNKCADEILQISKQDNSIPVNISKVLLAIGINEKKTDFDKIKGLELNRDLIIGAIYIMDDKINLCFRERDVFHQTDLYQISRNELLRNIRFLLAHELGHCCLHANDLKNKVYIEYMTKWENPLSVKEIEANDFAAELLIPTHTLREVHGRLKLPVLEFLCELFFVPREVMRRRLEKLKLPYYTNYQ